ncbi:MAG: hypothetical protein AB7F78_02945, partial [Hyphomicrobiaceae bacterium]
MTELDAATAWKKHSPAGAAIMIVVAGLGLAGCESAGNILGGNQVATEAVAQPPPTPAIPQMCARVALAPIIGAPDAVGQQLRTQLVQAAEKQRIGVLADRDASADYGMRGYLVAARDHGGIKVSYIWDVTDPSGKRVNRITGEQVTPIVTGAKDAWGSVTPTLTQAVADKVATSLAAWAPTQARTSPPAGVPVAAARGPAVAAAGAGAGSVSPSAMPQVSATATASLPPAASTAPIVTGAPGDGNGALAQALERELARQGVDSATSRGYRVEGSVTMGALKDGKQSIQTDWRVKDS